MDMNQGQMESFSTEIEKGPEDEHRVWVREIAAAKEHYRDFFKLSEDILKRYRDERKSEMTLPAARLNFFWSNTQVLKSTLYAKPPKVDVSRLFRDYQDDQARVASVMLERLLNHDLEADGNDFDVAARQAIDDWLIVGEGQVWYRYEVETEEEPVIDPMTGQPQLDEQGQPVMQERVDDEYACADYVHWGDFLCSPARTWQEVRWVAKRVNMRRDDLVKRFGEDIGNKIALSSRNFKGDAQQSNAIDNDPWATAEVWEIWCKTNRRVYWFSPGYEGMLDIRDDPLDLDGFFPCPMPLIANQTNNTLIPRADYSMARDQYRQIDVLVARLRMLIDACKVVGAYDQQAAGALGNILGGSDNKMVPVDNWALFGEKGGLKGVMDWVPIDMIANVIQVLRADLAEQKQQLYEVMGISDIMRGATRASETATAQQIKAQYGSTRLQFKQFEVARFVRDAQRIKAEIICKHYQPETILKLSNIEHTPDAQLAGPAIELLKNDDMAEYRLGIEPESMAMLDWASERDARTQFLQAVGGFVQSMSPLAQAKPEAVPVMLQLLQWGLGGFRIGKEIEGVIDQAVTAMQQQPQQPPDPMEQRMKQAQVRKVETEGDKNEASAAKQRAEAGGAVVDMQSKRVETVQRAMFPTPDDQLRPAQPGEYQ
jgi:hypothetical protein